MKTKILLLLLLAASVVYAETPYPPIGVPYSTGSMWGGALIPTVITEDNGGFYGVVYTTGSASRTTSLLSPTRGANIKFVAGIDNATWFIDSYDHMPMIFINAPGTVSTVASNQAIKANSVAPGSCMECFSAYCSPGTYKWICKAHSNGWSVVTP